MLKIEGIFYRYDQMPLLNGVNLNISNDEIVCLLGSSGSGKSTLLRIISGLESPERGKVFWDGNDITEMDPSDRDFGLMFQDYALFPHLDVFENVAFGLRLKKIDNRMIQKQVNEVLRQVGMDAFAHRRVTDLSGGEQQRIALARSLIVEPKLLLLDEPLGALDRSLKTSLIEEIRRILKKRNLPAIYVTHDQEEAFAVADKIALLNEGKILQFGTPDTVYDSPENLWVAEFFGRSCIFSGKAISANTLTVIDLLNFDISLSKGQFTQGNIYHFIVQKPEISYDRIDGMISIPAKVMQNRFFGDFFEVELLLMEKKSVMLKQSRSFGVEETVFFCFQPDLCFFMNS